MIKHPKSLTVAQSHQYSVIMMLSWASFGKEVEGAAAAELGYGVSSMNHMEEIGVSLH